MLVVVMFKTIKSNVVKAEFFIHFFFHFLFIYNRIKLSIIYIALQTALQKEKCKILNYNSNTLTRIKKTK